MYNELKVNVNYEKKNLIFVEIILEQAKTWYKFIIDFDGYR